MTLWASAQAGSALDGQQRRVHLEHLRDCGDAICAVGAFAVPIEPTELVAAQAAKRGVSKRRPL